MLIVGRPSAPLDHVRGRLPANTSTVFRDQMFPALWDAALAYHLDPVGLVAQSLKETGNGNYGCAVSPWHFNTAGIKLRDLRAVETVLGVTGEASDRHPLVHAQFPNWE